MVILIDERHMISPLAAKKVSSFVEECGTAFGSNCPKAYPKKAAVFKEELAPSATSK
jgi:hypothetical protein